MKAPPVALTIAGSDSSAGAGIQADLKTFSAHGVYGVSALTCVVAEIPGRVSRIVPLDADFVSEQIALLLNGFTVAALKTGLLCTAQNVGAVASAYAAHGKDVPLVVDPVMIATSGAELLEPAAIVAYDRELFPRATLITPNADEAARLLGRPVQTLADARDAGRELAARYSTAVLIKGGHIAGDRATDLLFCDGEIHQFSAAFTRGVSTHGTGCTYSAAIAANLASGLALKESVAAAKEYVSLAIAQHFAWERDGHQLHALNHAPARDAT